MTDDPPGFLQLNLSLISFSANSWYCSLFWRGGLFVQSVNSLVCPKSKLRTKLSLTVVGCAHKIWHVPHISGLVNNHLHARNLCYRKKWQVKPKSRQALFLKSTCRSWQCGWTSPASHTLWHHCNTATSTAIYYCTLIFLVSDVTTKSLWRTYLPKKSGCWW